MHKSLDPNPKIKRGCLANGLEYVVLANARPKHKCFAYLEVLAGSLNESDNEQGLAHFLEHVVFLGTQKYRTADTLREELAKLGMSFGGDTNAYTDTRHTVYTFTTPLDENGMGRIETMLDVLYEISFEALLVQENIDAERPAVLSEMQTRNSIGYRAYVAGCNLLHRDNLLSKRYPIGLEEQIKTFGREDMLQFYRKWYIPNNMRLYVVGSFEDSEAVIQLIGSVFGRAEKKGEVPPQPVIEHDFNMKSESALFQSDLFYQVSASLMSIRPLRPSKTLADMRDEILDDIVEFIFDDRIEAQRTEMSDPPFTSISFEISDSFREDCGECTLVINAFPDRWMEAVVFTCHEICRILSHGFTASELKLTFETIICDSEIDAEQNETQHSLDLLEEIQFSLDLGLVPFDNRQRLQYITEILPTITLEDVNARAVQSLTVLKDYLEVKRGRMLLCGPFVLDSCVQRQASNENEDVDMMTSPLGRRRLRRHLSHSNVHEKKDDDEEEEGDEGDDGDDGDDRMEDGHEEQEEQNEKNEKNDSANHHHEHLNNSIGSNNNNLQRLPSASIVEMEEEEKDENVAKKRKSYILTIDSLVSCIAAAVAEGPPPVDIDLPERLITDEYLAELIAKTRPKFLNADEWWPECKVEGRWRRILGFEEIDRTSESATGKRSRKLEEEVVRKSDDGVTMTDDKLEIGLMRLSNGVRFNYKYTDFVAKEITIRIVIRGGIVVSANEDIAAMEVGIDGVAESGIGEYVAHTINRYMTRHAIEMTCSVQTEALVIKGCCSTRESFMRIMEVLHLVFVASKLDDQAYARVIADKLLEEEGRKKNFKTQAYRSLMNLMFGDDYRMAYPPVEHYTNADRLKCESLVLERIDPSLMEICIVGDFESEQLIKDSILKYFGTLTISPLASKLQGNVRSVLTDPKHDKRKMKFLWENSFEIDKIDAELVRKLEHVTVPDPEPRAVIYVAFQIANYYGCMNGEWDNDIAEMIRTHPCHYNCVLAVGTEILSNRVHDVLREQKGLAYVASISVKHYLMFDSSYAVVTLTPLVEKIDESVVETVSLLRTVGTKVIEDKEFKQAMTPLVSSTSSSIHSNTYWMHAINSLQSEFNPRSLYSLYDPVEHLQNVTLNDVQLLFKSAFSPKRCWIVIGNTSSSSK